MDRKRKLETELFYIGLIFLAAGAGVWAVYHFALGGTVPRMPCFFDKVLGIYCPGCGGTRALTALVHGRLLKAVWYHPLIPYLAVVGGGFMLTQGMERLGIRQVRGWRYHAWYLYAAIGLIVLNFIVKNVLRLFWGIMM
jgi:hypothetical protein|nr:DUF2752 domain-containing protein [uncultured Acetatifactor sp.]